MKALRSLGRNLFIFLFGAFVYGALEILWRGYTHFSMLFLGGVLFLAMYHFENRLKNVFLPIRWILYAAIITAAEFITGLYLNLHLGLCIWDYSDKPFNILGQICLPYSVLWLFLSAFACVILMFFREMFEDTTK